MTPLAGLAVDGRSMDRLKADAARDPQAAVRQAAGQFEALFMQQLLKSMREAMPKSGLMDGPGQDMYTGMLDAQLAQAMAGRPGSLTDVIARQLSQHIRGLGGAAGAPAANPNAGATDAAGAGATAPGRNGPGPDAAVTGAGKRAPGAIFDGTRFSIDPAARAGTARDALPSVLGATFAAPLSGAPALSAQGALSEPQREFVRKLWPHALDAERKSGVPAAFVVGQAALESGWGRSEMRMPDGSPSYNLFGIKAGAGWKGATVESVTTEYVDGQPRRSVERFRAYGSYAEAFQDWSSLMSNHPRYGQVVRAADTVQGYAGGMQRAGYATDPRYASKLERTIQRTLELSRTA